MLIIDDLLIIEHVLGTEQLNSCIRELCGLLSEEAKFSLFLITSALGTKFYSKKISNRDFLKIYLPPLSFDNVIECAKYFTKKESFSEIEKQLLTSCYGIPKIVLAVATEIMEYAKNHLAQVYNIVKNDFYRNIMETMYKNQDFCETQMFLALLVNFYQYKDGLGECISTMTENGYLYIVETHPIVKYGIPPILLRLWLYKRKNLFIQDTPVDLLLNLANEFDCMDATKKFSHTDFEIQFMLIVRIHIQLRNHTYHDHTVFGQYFNQLEMKYDTIQSLLIGNNLPAAHTAKKQIHLKKISFEYKEFDGNTLPSLEVNHIYKPTSKNFPGFDFIYSFTSGVSITNFTI